MDRKNKEIKKERGRRGRIKMNKKKVK